MISCFFHFFFFFNQNAIFHDYLKVHFHPQPKCFWIPSNPLHSHIFPMALGFSCVPLPSWTFQPPLHCPLLMFLPSLCLRTFLHSVYLPPHFQPKIHFSIPVWAPIFHYNLDQYRFGFPSWPVPAIVKILASSSPNMIL